MKSAILTGACSIMALLGLAATVQAQPAPAPYPAPTSLTPYLYLNPAEEIALAKSAAPASISDEAEVWTLGPKGYETAVKGKNGFVCFVDRSWSKSFEDPEFWNPKVRAPQCANTAAAHSMLPIVKERASWVMAGASKAEIAKRTQAELTANAMPAMEPGNMVYMMSKQGYIADAAEPHWHAHIMFYLPTKNLPSWGAGQHGAPIAEADDAAIGITTYFILVPRWSDGSSAVMDMKHAGG